MNSVVICSSKHIASTLSALQKSGNLRQEGIVLWLGRRTNEGIKVVDVYEPAHTAEADFFHIPRSSMLNLHEHLRRSRLMVAAQVHSHPREAFHSQADDRWAIVRHLGALSIVIPYFAHQTTSQKFLADAAVFQLNAQNRWMHVPNHALENVCQIMP